MKKRKKKVSVSHTKRRVKRRVARAKPVKRRKPMAKKKSTTWDEPEDEAEVEAQNEQDDSEAEAAPAEPEPTTTEATDEGVYVCDSDGVAIKGVVHNKGDKVALTPEELESVQAVGVRILPA
jgi:hypothetical protein